MYGDGPARLQFAGRDYLLVEGVFLLGRDFCLPDDFKRLIVPVFAHRVVVSSRYVSTQKKSEQAETILREIMDTTRVPL